MAEQKSWMFSIFWLVHSLSIFQPCDHILPCCVFYHRFPAGLPILPSMAFYDHFTIPRCSMYVIFAFMWRTAKKNLQYLDVLKWILFLETSVIAFAPRLKVSKPWWRIPVDSLGSGLLIRPQDLIKAVRTHVLPHYRRTIASLHLVDL